MHLGRNGGMWLGVLACSFISGAGPGSSTDAHAERKPPAVELVVLGSGGPRAFGRGNTAYVVLIEGTARILVDAGSGAFVQLGKIGLDLDQMDIVLLTHLHIDHSSDLPAVFNARALGSNDPIQFRVFGPDGASPFPSTTKFLHLLFDPGGVFEYQENFGAPESIHGTDLPITLNSPQKEIIAEGDLHVNAIATHHGDCPSVAYRIDFKGESITFAGDMDATALTNLERLANHSDLLVVHAAVLDPPDSPAILYTLHTAPRKLGEAAQIAGVKHLLLSHIPPAVEEKQAAVFRSIRASYAGTVEFAHDGMRVPLHP